MPELPIKMTEKQRKALELLDNAVLPSKIKAQIEKSIVTPSSIDQGNYGTCGAAVFVYLIAKQYPQLYVEMAISLLRTGQCSYPFKINMLKVNKSNLDTKFNSLFIASVRQSKNQYLPVRQSGHLLGDEIFSMGCSTRPHEIRDWIDELLAFVSEQEHGKGEDHNKSVSENSTSINHFLKQLCLLPIIAMRAFGVHQNIAHLLYLYNKEINANHYNGAISDQRKKVLNELIQQHQQDPDNRQLILITSTLLFLYTNKTQDDWGDINETNQEIKKIIDHKIAVASGLLSATGHVVNIHHLKKVEEQGKSTYIEYEFHTWGKVYQGVMPEDIFLHCCSAIIPQKFPADISEEKLNLFRPNVNYRKLIPRNSSFVSPAEGKQGSQHVLSPLSDDILCQKETKSKEPTWYSFQNLGKRFTSFFAWVNNDSVDKPSSQANNNIPKI